MATLREFIDSRSRSSGSGLGILAPLRLYLEHPAYYKMRCAAFARSGPERSSELGREVSKWLTYLRNEVLTKEELADLERFMEEIQ